MRTYRSRAHRFEGRGGDRTTTKIRETRQALLLVSQTDNRRAYKTGTSA
jgi:hypothetical protein